MKPMHEHAGSKQDKSALRLLIILLIASLLATWLIVYFVNFLLRGSY